MTTGQQIKRYVLIVGSLLLALGAYFQPSVQGYEVDTVTAKVLQSLVYGFIPALVGYVAARIGRRKNPAPDRFYFVWHLWWGILVFVLAFGGGHVRQLQELLASS
jgi:hypothetical protein